MNSPLQVGLLGTGYIADWHGKALRAMPSIKIAAACDRNLPLAQSFARTWNISAAYASLEEMLAGQKLDAIHILLPPELHFAAAQTAIAAGVHVLLEKPMCTSLQDAQTVEHLAEQNRVTVGVGHNFLFHPVYESLKADVAGGVLGFIDQVTIDWSKELGQVNAGPFESWLFRDPTNVLLEIGPHSVGHALDLLGSIDKLRVQPSNPAQLPGDKTFFRRWTVDGFHNRTRVELLFSFVPGYAHHVIQVRGSLGCATADFEKGTYVLQRHTTAGVDFDRFFQLRSQTRTLRRQSGHNLLQYIKSKAKLVPHGSMYGLSIARAIEAFYAGMHGQLDSRLSPRLGCEIVATCLDIARGSGVSMASQPAGVTSSSGATSMPTASSSVASTPTASIEPKILILGGTGFIGRELLRQLTAAGHAVRVLVRSRGRLLTGFDADKIDFFRGNLANPADFANALKGISTVYHLARPYAKTWEEFQEQDIAVTRRIAEACVSQKIDRLIYTGTIDSYYAGKHAGTISDQTPLDPKIKGRNLYARSKKASEDILMAMHKENGLPVVILRPGIVIGRGGHPFHFGVGMWQHGSVCQIWGDGNNPLPLVLVEDVAAALVAALDAPNLTGKTINLVGPPLISARQYIAELESHAKIKLSAEPANIGRFYLMDMLKYAVKVAVRHPGRRLPTYRDWESRTQRANWNCAGARELLGWNPCASRTELIRAGIHVPADEFLG